LWIVDWVLDWVLDWVFLERMIFKHGGHGGHGGFLEDGFFRQNGQN
jgi:hypothetical protein